MLIKWREREVLALKNVAIWRHFFCIKSAIYHKLSNVSLCHDSTKLTGPGKIFSKGRNSLFYKDHKNVARELLCYLGVFAERPPSLGALMVWIGPQITKGSFLRIFESAPWGVVERPPFFSYVIYRTNGDMHFSISACRSSVRAILALDVNEHCW